MPLRRPSSARADIEFAIDAREVDLDGYLLAPLPVCETTPLASLVARELLVMSVGCPARQVAGLRSASAFRCHLRLPCRRRRHTATALLLPGGRWCRRPDY